MNNALIALGSIPELREEALEAAAAVGRVEVDHGETGCKTPDAAAYIKKMAARKAPNAPGSPAPRPRRAQERPVATDKARQICASLSGRSTPSCRPRSAFLTLWT